jgi:hypothetical protein
MMALFESLRMTQEAPCPQKLHNGYVVWPCQLHTRTAVNGRNAERKNFPVPQTVLEPSQRIAWASTGAGASPGMIQDVKYT